MSARWRSTIPLRIAQIASGAELGAQRVGTAIVKEAQQRVPVDTSSLQRTIRLVGPLSRGDRTVYQVIAGDETAQRLGYTYNVYYAPSVEYTKRPFLIPAVMTVDVLSDVRDAVREELT